MEEEEKKVSKHSGSVSIVIRLDTLWKDTHRHAVGGNFKFWNSDLDRIWCELAGDISNKEYPSTKENFDKFESELAKLGVFEDGASGDFDGVTQNQIKKRDKQYKLLMEKNLFLKRLENKLGKGTKWDEGDEDDFD